MVRQNELLSEDLLLIPHVVKPLILNEVVSGNAMGASLSMFFVILGVLNTAP